MRVGPSDVRMGSSGGTSNDVGGNLGQQVAARAAVLLGQGSERGRDCAVYAELDQFRRGGGSGFCVHNLPEYRMNQKLCNDCIIRQKMVFVDAKDKK